MRSLTKAEDSVELKGCWAVELGLMSLLMTTKEASLASWFRFALALFVAGVMLIICAHIPRVAEYWET